jgi:hypothetical protein
MQRAVLEDLGSKQRTRKPHRLIVISDGANTYAKPSASLPSPASVIAAFKSLSDKTGSPIRLSIVDLTGGHLRFPNSPYWDGVPGAKEGVEGMAQITRAAKGKIIPVNNVADLTRELHNAVGLYRWSLRDVQGETIVGKDLPINKPFPVPISGRKIYVLRLDTYDLGDAQAADDPATKAAIRFALEGGEKLRFRVVERDGELRIVPAEATFERNAQIVDERTVQNPSPTTDSDFSPANFRVGFLPPFAGAAGGNDIEFRIAVMNQDSTRFSPRPKAAWVEIQPGNMDQNEWVPVGDKYVFHDLNFQNDQPVPVLTYSAARWPQEASKAQVKIWFSTDEWAPAGAGIVRDSPLQFRDLSNLTLDMKLKENETGRGWRLEVEQKSEGMAPFPCRLKVTSRLGEAQLVRRQYYVGPETNRIRHVFDFADISRDDLRNSEVTVHTFESLRKIAAQVPRSGTDKPVILTVPRP